MGASVRKIIYLSGTRADFGLMKSTLQRLAPLADLSVAVTGMHLEPRFGRTVDEIRAAGLRICGEVPVDVKTRTPQSMSAGIGQCLQGVTMLLQREQPDILVVLGDRGEMLAGAIAALHLGIVCVHIHGGERSGTVDEPVRHAISKLVSYHFVATEESSERLIRMGESPDRIHITGAPGLDGIADDAHLFAKNYRAVLELPADELFLLAIFHPVVQQAEDAYEQTVQLLKALQKVALPVVWSEPNADAGSREILRALVDIPLPAGSHRARHFQRPLFCAAMKHCAVMVGNSSAGIIEAASFGTPVVNVGDRQRFRERNSNVQDVAVEVAHIHAAIQQALRHGKWPCNNKYGDGFAGPRIVECLMALSLDRTVLEKINTY
ncbi:MULTISPECIES: UDP-N-acetylglucosamine 2-epimerase [Polaromonas]|uniref:UDP-N-acetylglucosamine 2-epimerase n=1 Tax=Polaromonas aquatica TaxID=332657 RepID=A0ABW1U3J8_9BURK